MEFFINNNDNQAVLVINYLIGLTATNWQGTIGNIGWSNIEGTIFHQGTDSGGYIIDTCILMQFALLTNLWSII